MKPRTAALLLLSIAGLFLIGVGLSVRLWRAGLRTASLATEQRLRAIGLTASQALSQGLSPALLTAVARQNDLEAAYLLDATLRPLSGPGASDQAVSLLRIDPDRALRALRGEPSVGAAYHLEGLEVPEVEDRSAPPLPRSEEDNSVLAGYFPVQRQDATQLLVLEAGPAFTALPAQLRTTAWGAAATAFGLAALCALLVLAALHAAAREERLRAEAERGQTIRELAAMVAHEVRNPLGTIRAAAELLREQRISSELLDDILSEVARLSSLTTQFLQFSADPPLVVAALDLGALCDELCVRLRREHPDAAQLRIHRSGDEKIPLHGDPDGLRQVLLNLALNAVQAMQSVPAGQRKLALAARRLASGGAEVRLSDTGPGVPAAAQQSLFLPFRTTKPSGTGLGLVVSRRIVEKHGGTLRLLATAPDRTGASFVILLPKTPPARVAAPAPPAAAERGSADAHHPAV